ncbi:MAG TPA: efflux RND transporter periplasmic adaptor subunit [Phycisphaerae bacterium]|nr:efflux RND transporter periplasmic adaptor subunit [Phycisphaerae bacterium]
MSKTAASTLLSPLVRKIAVAAVFAVAVVILMTWLAGGFHRKIGTSSVGLAAETVESAGRPLAPGATVEPVRIIRIPATETAVGTIQAVHEISLASKLLARVIAVKVLAGQRVAKDEILVRLDDADLKARLQQAQAAVDHAKAARDQAQIEFDRIDGLLKQGNAAQIEFDRASNALRSGEAALRQAEQARTEAATILDYSVVRSPIDGTVIDKKVEEGDMVQPGQVLLTLFDPTRMQLVASVRESLTHRLKVGQNIGVFVEALGKECQGSVSEIVPEAESASRTFAVKVTGPCPPGIYSGMFGRLLIPLDEQEVLVVPAGAIRRIGQLDVVDVAEGGVVQRRTVRLGRTFGESIEVFSGLRPGEQVVVYAGPSSKSSTPATTTAPCPAPSDSTSGPGGRQRS